MEKYSENKYINNINNQIILVKNIFMYIKGRNVTKSFRRFPNFFISFDILFIKLEIFQIYRKIQINLHNEVQSINRLFLQIFNEIYGFKEINFLTLFPFLRTLSRRFEKKNASPMVKQPPCDVAAKVKVSLQRCCFLLQFHISLQQSLWIDPVNFGLELYFYHFFKKNRVFFIYHTF